MYQGLLHTHILLRYFILIMLVVVIIMAVTGLVKKKPYGKLDNKFSLYLLIFTHLQLVVGLILYFISPWVKFSSQTMKEPAFRYWTVEHVTGMVVAIALITVARITSKKLTLDAAKHMRMFALNTVAIVIIVAVILLSGRSIL
jgi:magnesium-transporting ATPase (P-type)